MVYMCSAHVCIVCIQELCKGSDNLSNQKILQLHAENESLNSQIEVLESNIKALRKEKEQIIAFHRKYSSRSNFESDIDDQVHTYDTVCSYVCVGRIISM